MLRLNDSHCVCVCILREKMFLEADVCDQACQCCSFCWHINVGGVVVFDFIICQTLAASLLKACEALSCTCLSAAATDSLHSLWRYMNWRYISHRYPSPMEVWTMPRSLFKRISCPMLSAYICVKLHFGIAIWFHNLCCCSACFLGSCSFEGQGGCGQFWCVFNRKLRLNLHNLTRLPCGYQTS